MVKPIIFQVVGFQNSGKTTLITSLIKRLQEDGLKTVSIKHHGHGGIPQVNDQKDSARHIESGAIASIVEGSGRLLLQAEQSTWTLEEKIHLMYFFDPDIIIVEGYKKESYPKLLLIKEEKDLELISVVDNIQCILYWEEGLKEGYLKKTNIPCFQINDKSGQDWIVHFIKNSCS